MRLHNFCIDHNVVADAQPLGNLAEVQPGRWVVPPVFDKDGRPVEYLSRAPATSGEAVALDPTSFCRRNQLAAAIEEAGLKRLSVSTGLRKKIRKKPGRKKKSN